jgi:ribosomal protein S18 acetylase RimI-like enzyme
MTRVRVEPATGDDLAAITDRWVALVADQRAHGSHLRPEENRSEAQDVLSQYVHTDNIAVARTDPEDPSIDGPGAVVGFVMFHLETGLYDQDAVRGIIDNVYVDPAYRDRAVGSRLLDYAEGELESAGAEVIALSVMADNEAAQRLYDRRGYEPHRYMLEKPTESDTHSKDDR